MCALLAAACVSSRADEPDTGRGPHVVDAGGHAMPDVITDGPERVARLHDDLELLVGLAPLRDPELDEVEAIERELDLFLAGRARVTLGELETRYDTLQRRVFARIR